MLEAYNDEKRSIAQQRIDSDEAVANRYGATLGVKLPAMAPDPTAAARGGAGAPTLQQLLAEKARRQALNGR